MGLSYLFSVSQKSFYNISWLHHPHPLANCMRKTFSHLHFSVCSMFDCPALSFAAPQLYGMVWYLPVQLCKWQSHHPFSMLENKIWNQFFGRSPGELSQRHAPCLSFTHQRLRSKPSTRPDAFAIFVSSRIKNRQTGPASAVVPEMNKDRLNLKHQGTTQKHPFSAMLVEPLASGVHFTICACHPDNWATGHANLLSTVSSANWRPDYLQAYTWVHWLNCDTTPWQGILNCLPSIAMKCHFEFHWPSTLAICIACISLYGLLQL